MQTKLEIKKYVQAIYPNCLLTSQYTIKCTDVDEPSKTRKLYADFYLEIESSRIIIEFDDMHHFQGNDLFTVILLDRCKNMWCRKNGVHLCRISYLEMKDIPYHLEQFFNKIKSRKQELTKVNEEKKVVVYVSNPQLYNDQRQIIAK